MKKFQVITDSTADLVKEQREQFDVDYFQMTFTLDGETYDASLDWDVISATDYYNSMRNGKRSITGLVKTAELEEKFRKYLDQGLDVLYISCSSKLSGSYNLAKSVASEIMEDEKYKDHKIVCIDSLRSNMGEGLMALDAAKLALEEKTIDEVKETIESTKLQYQTYATVGSLEWLKKAGRVKASAAFFGNLFGVKPIILGDAIGNNYAYKKVKGRKTSLDELIETVKTRITGDTVYIEHADSLQDAKYIENALSGTVKNIYISNVGPIIGATVGPDTITVNFFGTKVEIVGEE